MTSPKKPASPVEPTAPESAKTVVPDTNAGPESVETFVPDANAHADTKIQPPQSEPHQQPTAEFDSNPSDSQTPTIIHGTAIKESSSGSASAIGGRIGEYDIVGELGRGGMGVVYKARHAQLNRDVALKMILQGKHTGPDGIARFLTEARAVAHLQHPNIVQIFDIGQHEGLPYFSLEFVKGTDLQKKLAKQPQPAKEAAKLVAALAGAMQYAHDQSIVHRDLKPANILIAEDGTAKVSDFGLAKELDESDSSGTQTGTIMGSPSYMSPEQAGGKTHDIGPASDQYSLGAILYEMLTGRPPFHAAKPLDTVMQVVNNEPVRPTDLQPDIPVDLETICLKTLQKNSSQRYETCTALAEDLQRFLNDEPIAARPVSNFERFWRWCKRNPRVAIPSAAAILFMIAATGISTYSYFKVTDQNRIIQKEKEFAEEQQKLAEDSRDIANERADFVVTTLQKVMTEIDSKLAKDPGNQELRVSMLEAVEEMIDQNMDAALKSDELSKSIPTINAIRVRLADLWRSSGDSQKAEDTYVKALEVAERRLVLLEGRNSARGNIARVLIRLGQVGDDTGKTSQQRRQHFERAAELAKDIFENPDGRKRVDGDSYLFEFKEVYSEAKQNAGVTYLKEGDTDSAAEAFQPALEVRTELVASLDTDAQFQRLSEKEQARYRSAYEASLKMSRQAAAVVAFRRGDIETGMEIYEQDLTKARELHEANAENPGAAWSFATVSTGYAESLIQAPRFKRAREVMSASEEVLTWLNGKYPKQTRIGESLGDTRYNLAVVLSELGESDDSGTMLKKAIQQQRTLLKTDPKTAAGPWTSLGPWPAPEKRPKRETSLRNLTKRRTPSSC